MEIRLNSASVEVEVEAELGNFFTQKICLWNLGKVKKFQIKIFIGVRLENYDREGWALSAPTHLG